MDTPIQLAMDAEAEPARLDVFVAAALPQLSRAFIQKLCAGGKVLLNGEPAKAGSRVRPGDAINVDYDMQELATIPEIDLPVLYEDDDCIVLNKPVGVLTHSKGAFNPEATVATFIRGRLSKELNGERAGIVHRLDRATSGVIIGAKNQTALSWLQRQFAQRRVKKTYIAVVGGHLHPEAAVIDMPIERNPKAPATFRVGPNGKPAVTHYRVLQESGKYTLVELKPETGRTHQLRVHLKQLGHPIAGDELYGGPKGERLYLHAHSLEITLPSRRRKVFVVPTPPEFQKLLEAA